MLQAGSSHGGEHCKPGGVSVDFYLWHRAVEARQRLQGSFILRLGTLLRLLVLLCLFLDGVGLLTGLEHVKEVGVQQVIITDIHPGVGVSRLQLGAGHAAPRLVGVVLVTAGPPGPLQTSLNLLGSHLVFHD